MNRNKWIDFLILAFLYLAFSCFPWSKIFVNSPYLSISLTIVLQILYLVFAFWFIKNKSQITPKINKYNKKNFLLLLFPFAAAISNFIYAWCSGLTISTTNFNVTFFLNILLTFMVVINEELLFRFLLEGNLTFQNPLYRILLSAGIFALFHLSHYFSSFNPSDLVIVLYTFGIGIILGFLYEYAGSIWPCLIFHLLFNLLNQNLFSALYSIENQTMFYMTNAIVAIVIAVYLSLIYFSKKTQKNVEDNV